MWIIIILKVTKNEGFTLSLEDALSERPQGGSNWPFLPTLQSSKGLTRKTTGLKSLQSRFREITLVNKNLYCQSV